MRILVVEDDTGIAQGLRSNLRQRGYAVDVCDGVAAAWAALRAEPFDAVLLDLGLSDGDGSTLLQRLRANQSPLPDAGTPVLIMTARDAVQERIAGLDQGADDYLSKPFDMDELEARLRALLRRSQDSFTPRSGSEAIALGALRYEKESGLPEAVICGTAKIGGIPVSLAVMDFRFCGGAMGAAVGEKITRAIERALKKKIPCIVVSSSGGARMQEGIFSLMQMAKTSAALGRLAEAKLPFVSILTYPTTGGVTASFATLGDVILAEPGALIGFAGARVIKETTKQTLPAGFQTAEFLLKHGLVDQIVSRLEMKDRLTSLLQALHDHKYRPHKVPTASPFPSAVTAG